MNSDYLIPAIFAFAATAFAAPIMVRLARRIRLVDDPTTHKHPAIVHTTITPRGGGVPIAIGIILAAFFFLPMDRTLTLILLGAASTVIIGLLDDKYDLSPYMRFITNFIVALLPVLGGVTILFITNPLGNGVISFANFEFPLGIFGKEKIVLLADAFSIIWIVWTMNMLNWSTGVNGQMPGIAAISAVTIGFLSLRFFPLDDASELTAKLSFITAGAALGFLPFNFPKARIFPGYGGTIIGYMLAVLSILSGAKLATAILVMGVPTIDAIFTIIRRISFGRSPFRGDRGHFHHLLLRKGWSVSRVAIFYWGVSAILGMIALVLTSKEKLFAIIVLAVLVGGSLLWLSLFSQKDTLKEESA